MYIFLVLCVFSLVTIGLLVFYFSPSLSVFPVFFGLVFLFLLSLGSLVLRGMKHGILVGLFVVAYLLMRLNSLTHPFFLLLLLGIFLALELLFAGKKKSEHLKRQD